MATHPFKAYALVALAATALTATSAKAAIAYSNDDLLIGFRQAGNTSFDYVIDIGNAAGFRDSTGSFTLSGLSGLNADMTAAFGANWKTAGNITWGIVGTPGSLANNGDAGNTLYISEPIGTTPTATTAQATNRSNITALPGLYNGIASQGVTRGSVNNDPSNASSWSSKLALGFGSPGQLNPLESNINTSLDLFRLPNTSNQSLVTREGTFSFDASSESFTFTSDAFVAAPVPEPSTALFGCAVVGAFIVNRRRNTVAA